MDHDIVVSQMRASLRMLRSAIERCPEDLWHRESDRTAFWMLAYHAIYFALLYLSPSEDAFEPWPRTIEGKPDFGRIDLGDWRELGADDAYAKHDVLDYLDFVDHLVAERVASTRFDAPPGFHWLPFTRGETHLQPAAHSAPRRAVDRSNPQSHGSRDKVGQERPLTARRLTGPRLQLRYRASILPSGARRRSPPRPTSRRSRGR